MEARMAAERVPPPQPPPFVERTYEPLDLEALCPDQREYGFSQRLALYKRRQAILEQHAAIAITTITKETVPEVMALINEQRSQLQEVVNQLTDVDESFRMLQDTIGPRCSSELRDLEHDSTAPRQYLSARGQR